MAAIRRLIEGVVRAMAIAVALLGTRVLLAQQPPGESLPDASLSEYDQVWQDYGSPEPPTVVDMTVPPPVWAWSVDYRFRSVSNSHTSYEFGEPPDRWTPLSRLDFNLDSLWHGLQLGVQREDWGVHVEYLVPLQQEVHGNLDDFDWRRSDASEFTDLGIMRQRWIEGNMLDFGAEFEIVQHPFDLPFDVWSTSGFRWQRFHVMAYDLIQYKFYDRWLPNPSRDPSDTIGFNQQYYQYYLGGQLRSNLAIGSLPPVRLTFQGDWSYTEGNNVDHHHLREGDRYTMENTYGDTWHIGLTAEAPVRTWLSLGCQIDYLQTRTTGSHRLLNVPEQTDESWTYGVRAWADQTWLTAFVRISR
jgi:hypothetical protein